MSHDDDLQMFGVRIRAKRSFNSLPNDYNDTFASTYHDKGWKRHRQSQYYTVSLVSAGDAEPLWLPIQEDA